MAVGQEIRRRQQEADRANVVFAAAPSQNEFLAGLVAARNIDWSRVYGFHMDEYLGIAADHRASFRRYLQERLFRLVDMDPDRLRLIPGEQSERPLRTCLAYEEVLRAEPVDIVLRRASVRTAISRSTTRRSRTSSTPCWSRLFAWTRRAGPSNSTTAASSVSRKFPPTPTP